MANAEKIVEISRPPVPIETVERSRQEKINAVTREYGFELAAAETGLGEDSFHAVMEFASADAVEAPLAAHTELMRELAEVLSVDFIEANRNELHMWWQISDE